MFWPGASRAAAAAGAQQRSRAGKQESSVSWGVGVLAGNKLPGVRKRPSFVLRGAHRPVMHPARGTKERGEAYWGEKGPLGGKRGPAGGCSCSCGSSAACPGGAPR